MAFEFDRYINGQLMAEGVTIERQNNLSDAMREAARIASRGPNGEVPVLVLRALAERAGGVKVIDTDILREWFGGERYARDYEYLDTNYSEQANRVVAFLSTLTAEPSAPSEPDFASTIAALIKDECEGGAAAGWRSCTGCHETNEGYETGHYPYSNMFGCHVGHGCSECGGLGVVWEYWSESALADMARDIEPAAPEGRQEAMRIGDAVLDWMVKFDLLDAGNEYYVSDVLAVLNDLTPSTRPSEQAVTEAARVVLEWYERDGSVGGAVEPFEALKAAMEAGRHD